VERARKSDERSGAGLEKYGGAGAGVTEIGVSGEQKFRPLPLRSHALGLRYPLTDGSRRAYMMLRMGVDKIIMEPGLENLSVKVYHRVSQVKKHQRITIDRTRSWALNRVHDSRRPLDHLFELCDPVTITFDFLTWAKTRDDIMQMDISMSS